MDVNKSITAGKKEVLNEASSLSASFALADTVVYKSYLDRLGKMDVAQCPNDIEKKDIDKITRFFKINRFVFAKNESIRGKLISVFQAVLRCGGSVITLINSTGDKIDFYKAVKKDNVDDLNNAAEVLQKTFSGNFPGTVLEKINGKNAVNDVLENVFSNKGAWPTKQISTVTGIAGLRKNEEDENKFIQGMEKLIDTMQGEKYSILLIADPVESNQIAQIRRGYESLYSQLSPHAARDLNFGENESLSVSETISEGMSETINKSISDTLSYTQGTNKSYNEGGSVSAGVYAGIIFAGANVSTGANWGSSFGFNENRGESKQINEGTASGKVYNNSKAEAKTEGQSRNIQIKFENKTVQNLMEKINAQLKRLDESADTGMWNCSVYCLADNPSVSKIAASAYQSILRGENSSVEAGSITMWSAEKTKEILPWLSKMHHPFLKLTENIDITPTSFISSAELAIHAGIPRESVGGLPVLTMASFGREVVINKTEENEKEKIDNEKDNVLLGNIYHMGKIDSIDGQKALPVSLNKNSLASHTFITGSTGSGKSNVVYHLLDEICLKNKQTRFMVIEPAKGEYKHVFGNRDDVSVYGTNPRKTPLLKINPFKFPPDVHILEHLDRLVEIFNVCWPMYAAMPAVLKESIEDSYKAAGWDMQMSANKFNPALYPSFKDVTASLNRIMDSSDYSNELKGNYKGALVTRLKSLSNGINGMIFSNDEISPDTLFDKNVIIDLSRVGSTETKSLIMGIMVMKLQEYRMTSNKMNSPLCHITVLEEAHNLLRRVSAEQSGESSNIAGKSVEMLADAIAQMRTYGEGFIIADQSPGLLDMSVIRNTNTKIILRLPDQGDRELVGKAAGLNNDQINELSKLQLGTAAVYQNDWIQPVLCKIPLFEITEKTYQYKNKESIFESQEKIPSELIKEIVLYLFAVNNLNSKKAEELSKKILCSNMENNLKLRLYNFLETQKPTGTAETITDIIAGLFPLESAALRRYRAGFPLTEEWAKSFYSEIKSQIDCFDINVQEMILKCILVEYSMNNGLKDLPVQWDKLKWRII